MINDQFTGRHLRKLHDTIMGLYLNDDKVQPQKTLSNGRAILACILYLLLDVVIYSTVLPLIGTCIGCWCSYLVGIPPRWELVLVVFLTFGLVNATIYLFGEASYWTSLFAFEPCYSYILQVRDFLNVIFMCWYLLCLVSTTQAMTFQDKDMKKGFVSEGAGYVYMKTLCNILYIDPSVLRHIGLTPADPSSRANENFLRGASYVTLPYWAMLSSCVAKLAYFSTLFTYLRAKGIFISLKPSFADDDPDEEHIKQSCNKKNKSCNKSSAATYTSRQSGPSSLENNFTRLVRSYERLKTIPSASTF